MKLQRKLNFIRKTLSQKEKGYLMKKTKQIIVIDQRPLLEKAIKELENWHDKIELLEIEIQKFHDSDLKLYNDWLRLTLNDLQAENHALIDNYKKLALFHNWVVFTAEEQNISIPHAFFLMSQEDNILKNGSKEEKERIEAKRQELNNKINAEIRSEYGNDFSDEDVDESESGLNDDEQNEDNSIKNKEIQIRLMREKFQKEILFFENLTDKKIVKKMRQFDEGIDLISACVFICSQCYRFDIVDRIWAFAPLKIKTHFNLSFKKQMGVTLDQYLTDVKNEAQRNSDSEEHDEEFNFNAHFENPFAAPNAEVLPENLELAKIFYRRIMMKIHPDKLSTEFVSIKKNWLDRLWKKIQTAYDKSDVKALQNLHLQVLVTLKKYEELGYSDLKAGSLLLQNELTKMEQSHEETLQHPAWGFSKLKTYKKLEKTIAEPYKKSSKELKKDIKRIEAMHATLKEFVDNVQASGGFGKKRQRKPAKKRQKQQRQDIRQQNLF